MRLQIFQSDKGDCILLEGKEGGRILCDGGMSNSMKEFVSPELAKLREENKKIDVAYVSHIDQDHIAGILQLLNDELDWRIFEHQRATGNRRARKPANPRPPEIGALWHNSFGDQLGEDAPRIEDFLAAAVPALLGTRIEEIKELGEEVYDIATSIPEAIKVSRLASQGVLGIPLNQPPGFSDPGKLLMVRDGQPAIRIGSLKLTIVGPTESELKKLKTGWMNWLQENQPKVDAIDRELQRRLDRFSNGALDSIDLGSWNGVPNFRNVSVPNIASLMFMVEEDGKRLLLTGDSQQDVIIESLKQTGFLGTSLHLDVLKIQHHGSKNNLNQDFARQISADHYVFCGNGDHDNPRTEVIDLVLESRLGDPAVRALAPEADGRDFTFWFSSNSTKGPVKEKAKIHMKKVEEHVKKLVRRSRGKLKARFNSKSSIVLNV